MNLADEVAVYLRDEILTGRLKPDERIDQDAIADDLGLSRLPVREALITLSGEGLVRTIPRRGTYVERLTPEDIIDHYQIFGHMAGLAASRAAARASDEDIALLQSINDKMLTADDPAEQESLNFEFHRVINSAGASRRLNSLIGLLSRSLPTHYYKFVPDWHSQAYEHHAQILAAIQARDPATAQHRMEAHLAASARNAVEILQQQGFFDSSVDDEGTSA